MVSKIYIERERAMEDRMLKWGGMVSIECLYIGEERDTCAAGVIFSWSSMLNSWNMFFFLYKNNFLLFYIKKKKYTYIFVQVIIVVAG